MTPWTRQDVQGRGGGGGGGRGGRRGGDDGRLCRGDDDEQLCHTHLMDLTLCVCVSTVTCA